MSRKPIDITNKRFDKLVAVKVIGRSKRGEYLWFCRCDCGGSIIATGSNIRNHMCSCGCVHDERIGALNRTHGMSTTKLYGVWCGMKQRVDYSDHKSFGNYGGRGITVCDEWRQFEPFHDWALANGYAEGLLLDRIDNEGDYEPDNCRWTTAMVQANNRRPRRLRSRID